MSEYVREVKSGRTLVVTEHGQPVARMIPEALSVRERVDALRRAGAIDVVVGTFDRQLWTAARQLAMKAWPEDLTGLDRVHGTGAPDAETR
ncbi:MAG: hypothetical protein KBA95_04535 [Acidobacteria bacterium]|nr:hypothetical protein [Acidobacteriota bacterium]